MAAKKSSRPLARPRRRNAIRTVLAIVTIVAFAAVVTIVVLHERQQKAIAADQARFAQAEKDLDEVVGRIKLQAQTPLKISKSNSCSRPHLEFSQGPLSCTYGYIILYQVNDLASANTIKKDVIGIVSSKFSLSSNEGGQFVELTSENPTQRIVVSYLDGKAPLPCTLTYFLYHPNMPPFSELSLSSDMKYGEGITLNCGGLALQPYYKLEN